MGKIVDQILSNATVLTMNNALDQFTPGAVAINNDSIVAVGPAKKIEKDTERDNFMSSKEAMEYGLIDKVLTKSFT